jgi:lipopolysaccharide transport system ATP-binding protein
MPAVEALCDRALLLDHGLVTRTGPVRELVQEYHRRLLQSQDCTSSRLAEINSSSRVQKVFQSVELLDDHGRSVSFLPMGGSFRLRLRLNAPAAIRYPTITIGIDNSVGQRLLSLQPPLSPPLIEKLEGERTIECRVDHFPLAPEDYWIKLGLAVVGEEIDEIERVLRFTVIEADAFGDGRRFHRGVCLAPTQWTDSPHPARADNETAFTIVATGTTATPSKSVTRQPRDSAERRESSASIR